MLEESNTSSSLILKISNGLLLLVTMFLGVIAFFAMFEIITIIAANIVVRTMDTPLRQGYAVATVRNIWLFCGGMILLAFIVGAFEYYSTHLGNTKNRKVLLIVLFFEIVIILISSFV